MGIERSLKEVGKILNRLTRDRVIKGFVLIGGLSVSTWGVPRATKDIDLLISLESIHEMKAFRKALDGEGLKTKLLRGGPSDPVPYLLKAFHEDVPVDMLIATSKWEDEAVEAAVLVKLGKVGIPVIPVEYLIVMKLKAGGPRDILDAEELLQTGRLDMESLERLAKRLRVDKRLEKVRRGSR